MKCVNCVYWARAEFPQNAVVGICTCENSERHKKWSGMNLGCDHWVGKLKPGEGPAYFVGKERPELFVPWYVTKEESHRTMDEDHIMREVEMNQVADDLGKSILQLQVSTSTYCKSMKELGEVLAKQAAEIKANECQCWWCRFLRWSQIILLPK